MEPLLIAAMIFMLRIVDVSIGTIRVLYTVQGRRLVSGALGVVESAVWIFAISRALAYVDHPLSMIGWAFGFGAGAMVGITLERWVASGSILMRIISPGSSTEMRHALAEHEFGLTAIDGQGHKGAVQVLFVVAPRRRGKELIRLVQTIDPRAFVTIDPVTRAMGGYLPVMTPAGGIRK
jgi:uncharacterized protein YebE (UPF0316 family)